MPSAKSYLPFSLEPNAARLWLAQADMNADNISVVIDMANVIIAASDTWTYDVPFRLVGTTSGEVIPYTGTIGAAVALSNGSGPVPAVDSATPSVVMGRGTVTVSAGEVGGGSYQTGDVSTLTLTATLTRTGTKTDTFTVTIS